MVVGGEDKLRRGSERHGGGERDLHLTRGAHDEGVLVTQGSQADLLEDRLRSQVAFVMGVLMVFMMVVVVVMVVVLIVVLTVFTMVVVVVVLIVVVVVLMVFTMVVVLVMMALMMIIVILLIIVLLKTVLIIKMKETKTIFMATATITNMLPHSHQDAPAGREG